MRTQLFIFIFAVVMMIPTVGRAQQIYTSSIFRELPQIMCTTDGDLLADPVRVNVVSQRAYRAFSAESTPYSAMMHGATQTTYKGGLYTASKTKRVASTMLHAAETNFVTMSAISRGVPAESSAYLVGASAQAIRRTPGPPNIVPPKEQLGAIGDGYWALALLAIAYVAFRVYRRKKQCVE